MTLDWVITRELNEVLSTNYSILYITDCGLCAYYNYPTLKYMYVMNLFLRVGDKNNPCIRVTQENSIRNSLQDNLPYILLQMVRANYCTPYPKWPRVKYEANMWSSCYMTSSCSRTFYDFFSSSVINVVTTLSDVTNMIDYL